MELGWNFGVSRSFSVADMVIEAELIGSRSGEERGVYICSRLVGFGLYRLGRLDRSSELDANVTSCQANGSGALPF